MSEWLQKLLGVDPDQIPDDAVTSFEFAQLPRGGAALLLVLFVLAMIAGVAWIYRREGSAPTKAKIILGALRGLVLTIAILLLLEPVLAIDQVETVDKSTIVLLDESLSMTTKDRYLDPVVRSRIANAFDGLQVQGLTRAELVSRALRSSGLLGKLARQNTVEIFHFSDGVFHMPAIPSSPRTAGSFTISARRRYPMAQP